MKNSARSHKQSLECLRLESECKALAARTGNPALRSHFVRMAQVWSDLALQDLAHQDLAHQDIAHQDLALAADAAASKACAA